MTKEFALAVLKRFSRAAIAGGLAQAAIAVGANPTPTTFLELKTWLVILIAAFATGLVMGINKLYRFDAER